MIDSYLPFIFAHILLFIGLVYTSPASRLRLPLVFLIFMCCVVSVRSTFSLGIPGQAGGQYVFGMMMSSSHWLLLARASASTHAQTIEGWKWGLRMLCSARWGVSPAILPRFSSKDPGYIPSKRSFLAQRLWGLVWTSAALYLITHFSLYIYDFDFCLVPDGFLRRLAEVTPREWVIRVYLTVSAKGEPYLTLRAGHSLFSVIAVILGDDAKDWPPLFGSIQEAYRVRRFYVYFWHHLVRKVFTSHSSFFINNILCVPKQTEISWYLILAFTFLMSAAMHVFVALDVPLQCSMWPQLRYYFSIAGAIVIEDLVILGYKTARARLVQNQKSSDASGIQMPGGRHFAKHDQSTANPGGRLRKRIVAASSEKMPQDPEYPDSNPRSKGASFLTQAIATEDPMLKYFQLSGYVWVFAFEVWSSSKLLYVTQQYILNTTT